MEMTVQCVMMLLDRFGSRLKLAGWSAQYSSDSVNESVLFVSVSIHYFFGSRTASFKRPLLSVDLSDCPQL